MIEAIQYHTKHFSKRPDNTKIDCIVIHDTGARSVESTLKWFEDENSKVSSHYLVSKDGTLYECVPVEEKAWHAGVSILHGQSDVNNFSIGIELVDADDSISDSYPEQQMDALVRLCGELAFTYKIPLNRIVGHEHIAPNRKVDPGKDFPWFAFLNAVGSVTLQLVIDEELPESGDKILT